MKKLFSLFTLLVAIVMGAWATETTLPTSGSFTNGATKYELTNASTVVANNKIWWATRGSLSLSADYGMRPYQHAFALEVTGAATLTFNVKSNTTSARTITGQVYTAIEPFFNVWKNATVGSGLENYVITVNNKAEEDRTAEESAIHANTVLAGITSQKDANKKTLLCESAQASIATAYGSAINHNCPTTKGGTNSFDISLEAGKYVIFLTSSGGSVGLTSIDINTAGPVDPVFELSADEVEVGKTISVTGPDGLTFNAEPVSGTTGAVSVDGGTITGVTAGAAQVRVTSAATDDYNAYDHTFNITVTAAKIATELSFGTPTTTVARGEEVTNAATLTAGGEAISGTVTYSSDNESVATVDATGKVTGVKVGTANIKANFAGDATYSAAEEISYAITVTLPALTPVSNKIWTVKDAALLAEYPVNNSTKTKDITATNVIDNMEIVATSSKKMTMAYNANAATHADLPEGLTYRFQTLGMPGSDSDARYLHFKAAANSKVSAYFIQGTAGVNVAGYSLGTLDSENPTGICTNTAGDTGKMVFATGDTETDVYLYSASEGNSKGVQYIAVKVEPAATASVTLNAKGFATYSSDCAFAFSGAKAYKMALNESAKTMVGTEVNGEIAAGEGILFKGEAGATVTITLTSGAPSLAGNSLKGSTQADGRLAEKPEFCYALSGDTFKTFTGDALFANKAFFATENAIAQSFDIVFEEGEATAVDAIAEANANAAAPVKVIKNGKLYIGNFNVAGQQVK